MAQTTISIRMDDQLKHQFEEFCGAIGMSMTTAFNVFAKNRFNNSQIFTLNLSFTWNTIIDKYVIYPVLHNMSTSVFPGI